MDKSSFWVCFFATDFTYSPRTY